MKKLSLLCFLLCVCGVVYSQDDEFYHPELEWRSIETEHFYVHFHEGAERTARVVAKVAEDIYTPVTSLYQHKPDGKVSFVIKDYDDYSNGGAYFFDNKIEIWASSLDFDLRGTHNWLRNVVTHEFTHIVQIQTSLKFGRRIPAIYFQWLQYESERRTDVLYGYPNGVVSYPISGYVVPSWFAEGVAQFNRKELGYDSWDAHRDMILRMYALDNNMLTWNEMSVFGKTSLGNESSYNAGFAFVRYISERYGDRKLEEISRALSSLSRVTIDGAIEAAIGKSGRELYDEWRAYLRTDYLKRTEGMRNSLVLGDTIGKVGFANFYPTFSPDGKTLAYISNKESDYFGQSSLYLYDLSTKEEKLLKPDVRSSFSWSPDGKKIYYAKTSRSHNEHWSNLFDVYVYDIDLKEEARITHGLRANSPAVSLDGKSIAFVGGSDGTLNIFVMNIDGTSVRKLTNNSGGEQVYNPKWSPDGKTILFDYSIQDGRDIASMPADGGSVSFLFATLNDERNATYTPDGAKIIFTSDKTGIFNLYELDLATQETKQLTNVLGGAFMPAVNGAGQLAFASYTSTGYKLAMMTDTQLPHSFVAYERKVQQSPETTVQLVSNGADAQRFDWAALRTYDDSKTPSYTDTTYKTVATSLSFIPFLRVDNYNPKNKGIDVLKLGLYCYSYDVTDRYGFLAGIAFNRLGERDLFFNFDYRGKVPGLYQLGFEPAVSFEAYNITRKTENSLKLRDDLLVPVEITYSLLEFDIAMKQKIFTEALDVELRYAHSRYNASIGSFVVNDAKQSAVPVLYQSFGTLYFIGNDISLMWTFKGLGLSRTQEINPVGRKIRIRYEYEFNKFNPDNEYQVIEGLLVPRYQNDKFHRLDISWREYIQLPGWSHTLSTHLRGGTIFGPPVDNFYDFYIGGLAGMKGYPFYSLGGNEFLYGNLTYRFPVLEHIDLRFLQLYFDKLYAALYGDVGSAWSGGSAKGQRFRRDAGVELRLEAFSYYAFPTRIFFNATYGFDQFQHIVQSSGLPVTYGKEWNFHFGVLFGFDFD